MIGEGYLTARLVAYTCIGQAGDSRRGRSGHDGIGDLGRDGHITRHGHQPHEADRERVCLLDLDRGIGVEGLDPTHKGQRAILRAGDAEGPLLLGDDLEEGAPTADERGDTEHHGRAIGLVDLGAEGLHRLVTVVQLQRLLQLTRGVAAVDDGIGRLHHQHTVLALEAEDEGCRATRAYGQVVGVRRGGDRRPHDQLLAEVLGR